MKRFLLNSDIKFTDEIQKNKKIKSKSVFVECPICQRMVHPVLINDHIDSQCDEEGLTEKVEETNFMCKGLYIEIIKLITEKDENVKGLFIIKNFLTTEEEDFIINSIDGDHLNHWQASFANGRQEVKKWGRVTNYSTRSTRPHDISKGEHPLPHYFNFLVERLMSIKRMGFKPFSTINFIPNEANSVSYLKADGHHLKAHYDDRFLSGPILVNLSMLCDAVMTYSNDIDTKRVEVPRRSLQIVTSQSRYDYMHSIDNNDLKGERRVAVVFRQVGEKQF